MTLTDRIKEAVRQAPSMYVVSKAAGIADPVLSRFMAGERDIKLGTADKLVEVLGLELRPIGESATVEKTAGPTAKARSKGKTRGASTKKGKVGR